VEAEVGPNKEGGSVSRATWERTMEMASGVACVRLKLRWHLRFASDGPCISNVYEPDVAHIVCSELPQLFSFDSHIPPVERYNIPANHVRL
jgi:hypothetical protein